jgi:hypothetical protein
MILHRKGTELLNFRILQGWTTERLVNLQDYEYVWLEWYRNGNSDDE